MLAQRIYAIAMGYEDLNDHQSLRNDPVMQTITEQNREQEKASTQCLQEENLFYGTFLRKISPFLE